jgi:hypothetical protein
MSNCFLDFSFFFFRLTKMRERAQIAYAKRRSIITRARFSRPESLMNNRARQFHISAASNADPRYLRSITRLSTLMERNER